MPPLIIPPQYLPITDGLFALRGGPLCGLTTNAKPVHCVIPLHYVDPVKRAWLCEYRFCPDDLVYDFAGMERVTWG
jgi:hypothetical protein